MLLQQSKPGGKRVCSSRSFDHLGQHSVEFQERYALEMHCRSPFQKKLPAVSMWLQYPEECPAIKHDKPTWLVDVTGDIQISV